MIGHELREPDGKEDQEDLTSTDWWLPHRLQFIFRWAWNWDFWYRAFSTRLLSSPSTIEPDFPPLLIGEAEEWTRAALEWYRLACFILGCSCSLCPLRTSNRFEISTEYLVGRLDLGGDTTFSILHGLFLFLSGLEIFGSGFVTGYALEVGTSLGFLDFLAIHWYPSGCFSIFTY